MKLVLLSGGSGKRLWPLSNDSRSKQFLKLLTDDEGNKVSMVQRVWNQLSSLNLDKETIIATGKIQEEVLRTQLNNNIQIVIEPSRRDTFPAIALSVAYLLQETSINEDEVIIVMPVDSFVETKFFHNLLKLEELIISTNAQLGLIGVKPTFPSSKYGYIVPRRGEKQDYKYVHYFKEKPRVDQAEELIRNGALWNCGVFAFKAGHIVNLLNQMELKCNFNYLIDNYENLPKTSFDYAVVENAKDIITLSYDGEWKDLGTWNTLTDEMSKKISGKGFISEKVKNSHVVNELEIPITLLGIDNAVVAASPDGILVTDKDSSPAIKELIKDYNERPMYEERLWGWYKVLEYIKYIEGNEVLIKKIGILAGKNLSYHFHYKRSETWNILKGEGIFLSEGKLRHVRSGEIINIPLGSKHAIKAITDMEIIEIQSGLELVEEDVHRIALLWEDINNHIEILTK